MSNREGAFFKLGAFDSGVDAAGNLVNAEWLGTCVEKVVPATRTTKKRSNNTILKVVLIRNLTGGTIYGKKFYKLSVGASTPEAIIESVTSLSDALGQTVVVLADPYLPSTGVPANGIFYGVIKGIVDVTLPSTAGAFNGNIVVGGKLVATTSGCAANPGTPADATAAQAMADNFIMQSLEAKVAAISTNGTCKVMLDIPYWP